MISNTCKVGVAGHPITFPTKVSSNVTFSYDGPNWSGSAGSGHWSTGYFIRNDGLLFGYGYNGYTMFGNALGQNPAAVTLLNQKNAYNRTALSISGSPYTTLVIYDNPVTCFGLLPDEPMCCNMHGTCLSTDSCVCETGYTGSDCSNFTCYGISFSNTSVCSGNGICIALDICACDTGYTGFKCETFIVGSVYAFGSNSNYQLGGDMTFNGTHPVKVFGYLTDKLATQVTSMDQTHSALTTDGSFYIWGLNQYAVPYYTWLYVLPGTTATTIPRPYPYMSGTRFSVIQASAYSYHILNANRTTIYSFGGNVGAIAQSPETNYPYQGQSTVQQLTIPYTTFRKIASGITFAAFLTNNGTVKTWGWNNYDVSSVIVSLII
jgi:hypothetical protein